MLIVLCHEMTLLDEGLMGLMEFGGHILGPIEADCRGRSMENCHDSASPPTALLKPARDSEKRGGRIRLHFLHSWRIKEAHMTEEGVQLKVYLTECYITTVQYP